MTRVHIASLKTTSTWGVKLQVLLLHSKVLTLKPCAPDTHSYSLCACMSMHGLEGIHTLHDSRSRHNAATGIVTHAWRHHAHKFSSLAIDSWVQSWRLDMSNLHHWSWTLVVHLLWQKVKCVCASRGAQRSARVVWGVCSWDAESYNRWIVLCAKAFNPTPPPPPPPRTKSATASRLPQIATRLFMSFFFQVLCIFWYQVCENRTMPTCLHCFYKTFCKNWPSYLICCI